MRERTVMTRSITPAPVERPPLRPFFVDDQSDTYLVCAADVEAVREVARDCRVTSGRTGPGVRIVELPMTRIPEVAS